MRCPKCHAEAPDSDPECPHCGIIFAKYLERQDIPRHTISGRISDADIDGDRPTPLLFDAPSSTLTPVVVGRGVFLLLMCVWTTTLASFKVNVEGSSSFIHLPNLVFHEAGHILFMPFGRFMMVLGGSLTQVLVPLVCAGAFLWQTRDAFGAAIALWWAGQNLIDVATYINDARALQLVLLGGKTGAEVEGHDWEYLLNAMGVSHLDHVIAGVVQAIGVLTMIASLAWAAIVVLNQLQPLPRRRAER